MGGARGKLGLAIDGYLCRVSDMETTGDDVSWVS
jgi:hypothetical protein